MPGPEHIADRRLWSGTSWHASSVRVTPLSPVVLIGAGASMPHLPVADALKLEILTWLLRSVGDGTGRLDELRQRILQPHITLELFCSMLRYRCPEHFDPVELWNALCSGVRPSELVTAIARLRRAGLIGPILTTNFDRMIPDALVGLGLHRGQDFRFVTERQLREQPELVEEHDLCALHGTIYGLGEGVFAPPLTAMARGLARPFSPGVRRYLHKLLGSTRPVLVVGYSGQDHYDVNPVLHELHSLAPDSLHSWLWVCHANRPQERRRIRQLLSPEQIVVGDATAVLGRLTADLGLTSLDKGPASATRVASVGPTWKERLAGALTRFNLPSGGVRSFLKDLEVNLPGAWVVLEHYRVSSAGFDERTALTFGGVSPSDAGSFGVAPMPHLDYLVPPYNVPFGQFLHAQFTYRLEDESHYATDRSQLSEPLYPKTTEILTYVLERLDSIRREAPVASLRAEDQALLLVGVAIAENYLGLIERKRGELLTRRGDTSRQGAIERFNACTRSANAAGRIARGLLSADASAVEREMWDDLTQYGVWSLIGTANVARTLPRNEAISAFRVVMKEMLRLIRQERTRAARENGTKEDYLAAYDAQLWLRASELIKVILRCEKDEELPCSWDQLTGAERNKATSTLHICETAYREYESLSAYPNSRYPARFEAAILFHASRNRGLDSLTVTQRAAALGSVRDELRSLQSIARQYPDVRLVRSGWIERIEERTDQLLSTAREHDGSPAGP